MKAAQYEGAGKEMSTVNIMAMDVAFAHVGVAVMGYNHIDGWKCVHAETVSTEKSDAKKGVRSADDSVRRCKETYDQLLELGQKFEVVGVIAEIPTGGSKSSSAARAMGMGTAVAACVTAQLAVPTEWTTPDEGKLALCGKRNASKQEMKAMAAKTHPESAVGFRLKRGTKTGEYEDDYEHVADAIGSFVAARGGQVENFAVMTYKIKENKGDR